MSIAESSEVVNMVARGKACTVIVGFSFATAKCNSHDNGEQNYSKISKSDYLARCLAKLSTGRIGSKMQSRLRSRAVIAARG